MAPRERPALPSTASTAPGALLTGGAGASKMLALGTLLGGTVTVGLAAMLLRIGPAPSETPRPASAPMAASGRRLPSGGSTPTRRRFSLPLLAPPAVPVVAAVPSATSVSVSAALSPHPAAPASIGGVPISRRHGPHAAPALEDGLAREASPRGRRS